VQLIAGISRRRRSVTTVPRSRQNPARYADQRAGREDRPAEWTMLTMATSAGHPGRDNEDFVGAVVDAVVLVDGAGITGIEEICRHGIAWYAHRLGATILARLSLAQAVADASLLAIVSAAIDEVTDAHRGTCDVADPSSPSATVAVVRVAGGRADHLLLGDSVLVLDAVGAPVQVVEDRREPDIARPYQEQLTVLAADGVDADQVRNQAITAFRAQRNQPGGFWVAKDSGNVVEHAATGSRPAAGLRTVTLLSNGASRAVDRFGFMHWPQVSAHEPRELIRLVREAEKASGVAPDDATAVRWQF